MNDTTKPSKENDIVTDAYQDYNWQKLKILKKKTQRSRDTIFIVATYMMLAALFQLGTSKSDDKRAFFISLSGSPLVFQNVVVLLVHGFSWTIL